MRSGWKTTEFWGAVALALGAVVASLADKLDPGTAAVAAAIASGLYAISRGLTKSKTPPEQKP